MSLDPATKRRVRSTDPSTSAAAAQSIAGVADTQRGRVLQLLNDEGPMPDHELVAAYQRRVIGRGWPPASASSLRTRRRELYDDGEVDYQRDAVARTLTGRTARVWYAVAVYGK